MSTASQLYLGRLVKVGVCQCVSVSVCHHSVSLFDFFFKTILF